MLRANWPTFILDLKKKTFQIYYQFWWVQIWLIFSHCGCAFRKNMSFSWQVQKLLLTSFWSIASLLHFYEAEALERTKKSKRNDDNSIFLLASTEKLSKARKQLIKISTAFEDEVEKTKCNVWVSFECYQLLINYFNTSIASPQPP